MKGFFADVEWFALRCCEIVAMAATLFMQKVQKRIEHEGLVRSDLGSKFTV